MAFWMSQLPELEELLRIKRNHSHRLAFGWFRALGRYLPAGHTSTSGRDGTVILEQVARDEHLKVLDSGGEYSASHGHEWLDQYVETAEPSLDLIRSHGVEVWRRDSNWLVGAGLQPV